MFPETYHIPSKCSLQFAKTMPIVFLYAHRHLGTGMYSVTYVPVHTYPQTYEKGKRCLEREGEEEKIVRERKKQYK